MILTDIKLEPESHTAGYKAFLDYFKLIPGSGGIAFLHELFRCFAQIPYENISKIIRFNQNRNGGSTLIRLPEQVIFDHIYHQLGGTCFSLTYFLQSLLTLSGYQCYPVMADMRAGKNIHCCLVVLLDGLKYLVDPGYLLNKPFALSHETRQIYHVDFAGVELRFDAISETYNLFTFNKNDTKWRYAFQDRAVSADEFLQHWLNSFDRNSMHGICLSKNVKDGILFVNRTFMRETTYYGKKNFNIRQNYHNAIKENFGIDEQIVEQAQTALFENLKKKQIAV